jgi:hypothetical protein
VLASPFLRAASKGAARSALLAVSRESRGQPGWGSPTAPSLCTLDSHFTSFHTTRFTLHISHFTPHTSPNRESPVPLLRMPTNTQNRPLLILRRGAGCVIVGEGCDGTNSIDGSPTRGDASASSAHTIHWAGIMRSA